MLPVPDVPPLPIVLELPEVPLPVVAPVRLSLVPEVPDVPPLPIVLELPEAPLPVVAPVLLSLVPEVLPVLGFLVGVVVDPVLESLLPVPIVLELPEVPSLVVAPAPLPEDIPEPEDIVPVVSFLAGSVVVCPYVAAAVPISETKMAKGNFFMPALLYLSRGMFRKLLKVRF